MLRRHLEFIKERQYVMNVSPATIRWYMSALKWLDSEEPTQEELTRLVVKMRERGLKATGCNAATRAINAYLHWASGATGKCGGGCRHPHIKPMKEPEFVPSVFTDDQVKKLINLRARRFFERRLHLLILILLDTGCRVSEATTLKVNDVDMDNLLLTLTGKGRKQRKVPFSLELRKALYRYLRDFEPKHLLLASRAGDEMGRGTALHDVKRLCRRLGFEPPARTLHAFRHTFATNYLRRGGSVFHLQKTLGHTSLEMSRRYANLQVEDLQRVHQQVSLLSAAA
ncbi:MAG TPA: tyrosine-type recombinase/integrase [Terriglobales bacterium]|nr:tyrosine-type recombinase/integrase [Terriglobales bacterium]